VPRCRSYKSHLAKKMMGKPSSSDGAPTAGAGGSGKAAAGKGGKAAAGAGGPAKAGAGKK